MSLHPFFKTLATEPQLLLEHAAGYAELASQEAQQLFAIGRQRALWAVLVGVCFLSGVILAGGAVLVLAAVPYGALVAPALLWLAPAVPLLAGLAILAGLRSGHRPEAFLRTRAQWIQDRTLLSDAQARA